MPAVIRFRLKVDQIRKFRTKVRSWKGLLQDLSWAWPIVGEAISEYHKAVFDSEGRENLSTGGTPWMPLAEPTIRARLYHERVSQHDPFDYAIGSDEGPESRILHWSHRLRDSLVRTPFGTFDSVRIGTKTSFEFGTETPYAKENMDGATVFGNRILPARPFLDHVGGSAVGIGVLELALQARMAA